MGSATACPARWLLLWDPRRQPHLSSLAAHLGWAGSTQAVVQSEALHLEKPPVEVNLAMSGPVMSGLLPPAWCQVAQPSPGATDGPLQDAIHSFQEPAWCLAAGPGVVDGLPREPNQRFQGTARLLTAWLAACLGAAAEKQQTSILQEWTQMQARHLAAQPVLQQMPDPYFQDKAQALNRQASLAFDG